MAQTIFQFSCPCCSKWLEVDTRSGKARAVRPDEAKGGRNLDQLLDAHKQEGQRLDQLFHSAKGDQEKQRQALDQKLARAKDEARKDPDQKPRNPFDLD